MNAAVKSIDFADLDDAGIQRGIASAIPVSGAEAEPPRPLRRPMRAAEPYPVEALGPVISAAVRGTQELSRAPFEICAQSALAHAALAVQGHADIELPTGSQSPVSLFLLSVAESGDRKSTADRLLGWALKKHEDALSSEARQAWAEYENDKEAYDAARSAAKQKSAKGGRQAISNALDEVDTAPIPPLETTLSFPEPTIEGLQKYLAIGQPSVGLFAEEGGMFVGGVGMSKEHSLKSAAGFSCLWDGAPVKRLRSGDGKTVLYGRRVSMHLMIQPLAASAWLADPVLRNQGLFSRMLIAAPASLAGTRFYKEPPPTARLAVDRFGARILSVLETPSPMREGKIGELDPRILPMSSTAAAMWFDFGDSIEAKVGPRGELQPIRGLAGKIPELAARIAAVLALFDDLHVSEIDERMLGRGIKLAKWYLGEALRLEEVGHVSDDVRLAEAALQWLHESWPHHEGVTDGGRLFSVPDLYQFGPYSIRTKDLALRAIGPLEGHGWVEKLEGKHRVRGIWRRDVYSVKGGASDGRG